MVDDVGAKVIKLIGYYNHEVLHEDTSIPTYKPVSVQYDTKPILTLLRGTDQYYTRKEDKQ